MSRMYCQNGGNGATHINKKIIYITMCALKTGNIWKEKATKYNIDTNTMSVYYKHQKEKYHFYDYEYSHTEEDALKKCDKMRKNELAQIENKIRKFNKIRSKDIKKFKELGLDEEVENLRKQRERLKNLKFKIVDGTYNWSSHK